MILGCADVTENKDGAIVCEDVYETKRDSLMGKTSSQGRTENKEVTSFLV